MNHVIPFQKKIISTTFFLERFQEKHEISPFQIQHHKILFEVDKPLIRDGNGQIRGNVNVNGDCFDVTTITEMT